MPHTAIIIDDEERHIISLKEKLRNHCPEIKVIMSCESGADGLEAIHRLQPDIIFLDVEMPGMNGFDMLQQLNCYNFRLIFCTSYNEYAIQAIEQAAIGYLLKPVDKEKLKQTVQRAIKEIKENSDKIKTHAEYERLLMLISGDILHFKTANSEKRINPHTIFYLKSNGNIVEIYTKQDIYKTFNRTLQAYTEPNVLPDHFCRVHKSFVVNLLYIESFHPQRGGVGKLLMSSGEIIPIGRKYLIGFREKYRSI